jgi:3-hydroxyacyl-[acyl-carrier-protein] dehydratase
MRWFWIDRFTEFVSGKSAVAVKSVSLSEEVLYDYAPGRNYLPASLIIEGIAQTGGLLVGQISDFRERIVLAKINSSEFFCEAYPGETLTYRVQIRNREGIGTMVEATSHIDERLQGKVSLMFAALDNARFAELELFEPAEFCRMIRLLRLFEVGVHEDGTPVQVPEYMIAAEKEFLKIG